MTQTKLSTPYPPLSSPSPTRQVRWPLSKEKKSTTHPKDTYAELVFPCKCFENWEKKKNSPKLIQHWVTRTCSLQLQLKINTKLKKKRKKERKTKQNKTKNNSNGKWSKAYYVVSTVIKVAIIISLIWEEKRERLKESICLYLDMVSTGWLE